MTTYSIAEAAQQVGCSERWYADQIRARRFPARKVGRSWRLTPEDIAAALDACRTAPRLDTHTAAPHTGGMTATTRRRMRTSA